MRYDILVKTLRNRVRWNTAILEMVTSQLTFMTVQTFIYKKNIL